jgi:hypothetical protein
VDGVQLSPYFGAGTTTPQFARLLPGPTGSVYAAVGNSGGIGQHWYVQRVLPSGGIAPAWPAAGDESGGAFGSDGVGVHAFLSDGSGDCWHAWNDGTAFTWTLDLHAVHPDASISPSPPAVPWNEAYVADKPRVPRLATDGAGGVYMGTYGGTTGRIRVQHLLGDGSNAPGWSPRGRLVSNALSDGWCDMLDDGAGGVIVIWAELAAGGNKLLARRLNADTTYGSGWPAAGLALGTTVDPANSSHPPYGMLLRSGADHLIACWTSTPTPGATHVYLERFGLDGSLDPAWPAAGLDAVAPGAVAHVTLVSDGLAGVHVLWEAGSTPLTTHVLASGQYASGHDANGVHLVDAAAGYTPQSDPSWGSYAVDHLAGATGPLGGLIFAWPDVRGPNRAVRVRWLLASGQPDPAEADSGRVISAPSAGNPGVGNVNDILPDGAGGAYITWWHELSGALEQRLMRGERGVVVGVASPGSEVANRLVLHAPIPNPARGSVEFRIALPDGSPARLELYDIGGRVVRALDVSGPGARTVRLTDLGALSPGLYFARLTQGAARQSVRLAFAQ